MSTNSKGIRYDEDFKRTLVNLSLIHISTGEIEKRKHPQPEHQAKWHRGKNPRI